MSKTFPLQPLLDLANNRMDGAARRLGELIAGETEDCRKLELLENYRAEYQQRFQEACSEGIGPDAWRNFSLFINKLDEAVSAQRAVVEQARKSTAHGQKAWMDQRNKVKAFDTLSQRHVAKEARIESRREQHATDEHASKQHRDRHQDS
ncbi:flagellar export protein FliJ [Denitromonas ohlonensis]|jgi:flagellar FliJ protein|uniref:Flagellar FliJ protein n=2 Tax=Denitromonas TaxID=139331 RepID=A0A557S8I3_9RHOO|nr:flagellar export protein FliJ [Denitromonas ohlonensis]TVT48141.1 MAG: flagellar export protein FliJ [Denitromonas halophila]TVO63051.1 flagellar export protein FliJ [Denitromonas ohlonensis]TVO73697.1 flagellar export protein FliJ [Denitromonas ohlonensis]TVT68932.1 MAG: flagellar export protein FliJ [Denitromonas halophila]TVT76973.1 MAG: flagellar export protein FliJ [Denitromonas halophila]